MVYSFADLTFALTLTLPSTLLHNIIYLHQPSNFSHLLYKWQRQFCGTPTMALQRHPGSSENIPEWPSLPPPIAYSYLHCPIRWEITAVISSRYYWIRPSLSSVSRLRPWCQPCRHCTVVEEAVGYAECQLTSAFQNIFLTVVSRYGSCVVCCCTRP